MFFVYVFITILIVLTSFILIRRHKIMNTNSDLEIICKEIINHHGFSSNTVRGFSCYISDKTPFPTTEGLLLWNFSKTYKRIETQIQKYSSTARIFRMKEMLGLSEKEYEKMFIEYIQKYLSELKNTGIFKPIASGLKLFGKVKVFNLAANLNYFLLHPEALGKLEEITLTNPIVKFCEESGYFICRNKDDFITDKYLSK